jgi:hypothetical protein
MSHAITENLEQGMAVEGSTGWSSLAQELTIVNRDIIYILKRSLRVYAMVDCVT